MEQLEAHLINLYGQDGTQWLANLSRQIAILAEKYRLTHLKTMPGLSYNYVVSARQDTIPVVLKQGSDWLVILKGSLVNLSMKLRLLFVTLSLHYWLTKMLLL